MRPLRTTFNSLRVNAIVAGATRIPNNPRRVGLTFSEGALTAPVYRIVGQPTSTGISLFGLANTYWTIRSPGSNLVTTAWEVQRQVGVDGPVQVIEELAVGELIKPTKSFRVRNVALAAGSDVVICEANPWRRRLIFGQGGVAGVALLKPSGSPTGDYGITLSTSGQSNWEVLGDDSLLLQTQWIGRETGGVVNLMVIEEFWMPEADRGRD
ncbi:MAG: hypothetical protein A2V98_17665 [Planctomycetes bacterium RBG_16_64_12]|nr:MAG: hypothetical protein A2V98_17665 [Planctomycetes bacterium RBG_16_64_12]